MTLRRYSLPMGRYSLINVFVHQELSVTIFVIYVVYVRMSQYVQPVRHLGAVGILLRPDSFATLVCLPYLLRLIIRYSISSRLVRLLHGILLELLCY